MNRRPAPDNSSRLGEAHISFAYLVCSPWPAVRRHPHCIAFTCQPPTYGTHVRRRRTQSGDCPTSPSAHPPLACESAGMRKCRSPPRRVQGPFPPQYSVLPSVIVQAARSIVAAAVPAIQAAESVTVPAPTTTISVPSSVPSFVTAAECRTNRECRDVVEPPPPSDRRFAHHRPASSASEISWPDHWVRGLPDRAWRGRCMVRRCLD